MKRSVDNQIIIPVPLIILSDHWTDTSDCDASESSVVFDNRPFRKRKIRRKTGRMVESFKGVVIVKKPTTEVASTSDPLSNSHMLKKKLDWQQRSTSIESSDSDNEWLSDSSSSLFSSEDTHLTKTCTFEGNFPKSEAASIFHDPQKPIYIPFNQKPAPVNMIALTNPMDALAILDKHSETALVQARTQNSFMIDVKMSTKKIPNNSISPVKELLPVNITSYKKGTRTFKKATTSKKSKQMQSRPLLQKKNAWSVFKYNNLTMSSLNFQELDDSVINLKAEDMQNEKAHQENCMSLCNKDKSNESSISKDDDRIILEDSSKLKDMDIPRPVPSCSKLLRPIVIDGSNVARMHGNIQNTYSCKGIQISVNYFLKRGHTHVTAFVPGYRRYKTHGRVPTTDIDILEELASSQHVVFTPFRNINGKRITCYENRFIVELAANTDGVIFSNDNFQDLLDESDSFKKAIEERLLMFCFVRDMLMVPNDPLGRNGPCLDDFLSFPRITSSST